ncbi:MAG: acetylornithine/succinylornithine family transaminase [Promethearchaeota archaeon]
MNQLEIEHAAIVSNSEEESDLFFVDLLGCKKTRSFTIAKEMMEKFFQVSIEQDVVRYEKGNASFEVFISNKDKKIQEPFTHTCLLIHNRDGLLQKAKKMGFTTIKVHRADSDLYYFFLKDHHGNIFEIKDLTIDNMSDEKDYLKIIESEAYHHTKLFPKRNFIITRGEGALLYDQNGKIYIDCVAGHGVMNIGHAHPKYIKALQEQLNKIVMVPSGYAVEERHVLLKKLDEITPKSLTQSFLSNSGTESIEAAIKLALVSNRSIKSPEIIAFKRDFHGRSLGSLATTFNTRYRKPFMSWLSPHVKFASHGNIDSVRDLISDNTVAIVMELVQGEGGVYPFKTEFPKELRELCDDKGLILIDDEIQTGFGRTGKMFAYEHYDITPDVICMAKGIAGGLPMGATVAPEELWNNFQVGEHYTTFGGNPFVCTAANATINIILEENLVENSAKMGAKMLARFREMAEDNSNIREVRGLGLMIGVDFRKPVNDRIQNASDMGVLFLNAGMTVIRLLPPLIINDDQVEKVINVMNEIAS